MLLQCMEIHPSKVRGDSFNKSWQAILSQLCVSDCDSCMEQFDKRNMWEALRVAVRAGHLEAVKVILLHDKASDIDMGYSVSTFTVTS